MIRQNYMTLGILFILSAVVYAELPPDAKILECEKFQLSQEGWTVRTHEKGAWYAGKPSENTFLGGQSKTQGTASITVTLPKAGTYRLCVRYLDMLNHREKNGFRCCGVQNGTTVFEKKFDDAEASFRATSEGEKKWGDGFARWVWDTVDFTAEAGPLEIRMDKVHAVPVHGCGRDVDVMILTADTSYVPDILDTVPLYVKIRMLPEQPHPVGIHVFGKRPFSPWYTPHANITRTGWNLGINTGVSQPENRLAAGEESPWVNVAGILALGGRNQVQFYAMRAYGQPETEAYFEVLFSKTPSEEGVFRQMERRGPGSGCFWSVDLMDLDGLTTEIDGSKADLDRARDVGEVPGKAPLRFPFSTGLGLKRDFSTSQSVENEEEALRTLGLSQFLERPSAFYFHLTDVPGCLSSPNVSRIETMFQDTAKKYQGDFSRTYALNAMDEPGFSFSHVEGCEECRAGWKAFLESQGVSEDLSLQNDPEKTDPESRKAYYYTRRYVNHIMTEMLRVGTTAAGKSWKGIPVTVNFATEVLSGNMVSRGLDWYEIFDTGALTYGWCEDWGGWNRTCQTNGYIGDALRSACRTRGVEFGIYNVLCGRDAWEIQAKGFLEIGRGIRAIRFFNYGPEYCISSDTNSTRPEVYAAMKRLTFATGAVENTILDGRVTHGDVAMLHSVTGEIWHANGDYAQGRERVDLNLLLRHCNVACDVLGEAELPKKLAEYRILFACDSHLRRECVPGLVDWVKQGGVLYLSAGALEYDEWGEPLGLLTTLGVSRPPFQLVEQPGRPLYEMRNRKELANIEGIRVICGTQGEPRKTTVCGKGRVVCVGFFPAMAYVASAESVPNVAPSFLDFPEAPRLFLQKILTEMGVSPRLKTDLYRVEASLIESPTADVIVLSNWTGTPQTVEITLENAPEYQNIRLICGKLLSQTQTGTRLTLRAEIAAGDYVWCEKTTSKEKKNHEKE